MIQYSILISINSYPCCFHLGSAFIFVCPSLSLFFLPVPISFLPLFTPHLPAHSLSSSLPSSFFLFFSSYSFSFIPFFYCQLLAHFFHSHLFFRNQFCSYPLFPYFIPYSSLLRPLNFSAPPQSPHLTSFSET